MKDPIALFIHGAGGGAWEWHRWTPLFEARGWTSIARDLQPSVDGLAKTCFGDYQQQVASWLPDDSAGPIAVIGASMGGLLALSLLPQLRIHGIVLINSALPAPFQQNLGSYPPIIEWSTSPLQDCVDAMPDCDAEWVSYAHARWRDESGRVLSDISEGIVVASPHCPTLVIACEGDEEIPSWTSVRLAEEYGSDRKVYADLAHLGPLLGTRAELVALETLEWLEQKLQ